MYFSLPKGIKAHLIFLKVPYFSGKFMRSVRIALKINKSESWMDGTQILSIDGTGIQYGQWRKVNHKPPEKVVEYLKTLLGAY